MKVEKKSLAPGLYFVATPIGAARDITLRGLDILASADVLAAEDTRTLRHLMRIHGLTLGDRQVIAYNDHNGGAVRPRLLGLIADGKSVAYASEAGTPLISDPGFQLGKAAQAAGHLVTSAPGPSAVMAALAIAGLPTDRFFFAGFPPAAKGARASWLAELRQVPATLLLYESPKRIARLLAEMAEIFGGDRAAAICRELTKRFEEVLQGDLEDLATRVAAAPLKGEIVLVVDRDHAQASPESLEESLRAALREMSVKDAAATVATALGLPKRQVYQAALALSKDD